MKIYEPEQKAEWFINIQKNLKFVDFLLLKNCLVIVSI